MIDVRRISVLAVVGAVVLLGRTTGDGPAAAGIAAGAIQRFDPETFKRLDTVISDGSAADEFGTQVWDGFVATAPAADGGGRLFFVSSSGVVSSAGAAELASSDTARLGEDFADLGHPPGTDSALAVGAPGAPGSATAAGAALPTVVVVEFRGTTFVREVGRVTGAPGSLFGWRVRSTDSQFPAASFNGSYIVGAPLEDRGARRRVGSVSKHDTNTGTQLWKFRGGRAGELAGYDLQVTLDANADGVNDVLVGAPGSRDSNPAGRVYLLSGADGSVLDQLEAPEGAVLFGYRLAYGGGPFALFPGILVSAPGTPKAKKDAVGAVYVYADLDAQPQVIQGRRRNQWFGISLAQSASHLFVGSFERHRKPKRDGRGSVTVVSGSGKTVKTLRGKKGGEYFGRAINVGAALAIGAPGAPPLFGPQ